MKKLLAIVAMLTISAALFAKGEVKTIVYTTSPQMHCESCENKIKGSLKFVSGVKSIVTNVGNQTVTIQYDAAKTTTEKLEAAFRKVGYEVKLVEPADEATSASASCCSRGSSCCDSEKASCCK